MTSIGNVVNQPGWNVNPNNPVNAPGSSSTSGTNGTNATPPVGNGNLGGTTALPPTGSPTAPDMSSVMQAMVVSLASIIPNLNDDQQDVELAEVTMAMKQLQEKTGDDQVNNQSESQKRELDIKEKKMQEAAKKAEDAAKEAKSGNIWDKIKAFFEAIGAALAIVLGAVLDIIPGAGAALIVAGVAGMILAVNDEVQQTTGLGIAGNLDKLTHPDDPASWQKADMGFQMALMGVAVVGTIVGLVTGSGEAMLASMATKFASLAETLDEAAEGAETMGSALSGAADAARNASETFAALAEKMASMMDDADQLSVSGQKIMNLVQVTTVVTNVGTAVGNVVQASTAMVSTEDQAKAKKLQAEEKALEALLDELSKVIDIATKQLASNGQRWSKMIDSVTDAMKDTNDHVNNAKFTA